MLKGPRTPVRGNVGLDSVCAQSGMSKVVSRLVVIVTLAPWGTLEAAFVTNEMAPEVRTSEARTAGGGGNRALERSVAFWNAYPSGSAARWFYRASDAPLWSDLVLSSHHDSDSAFVVTPGLARDTAAKESLLSSGVELAAFTSTSEPGSTTDVEQGAEQTEGSPGNNPDTPQQGSIAVWLLGASVLALIGIGRRRSRPRRPKPNRPVHV